MIWYNLSPNFLSNDAVSNAHAKNSGLCSREQPYRPEDCSICHASVIAQKGSGFWEGGKGTRDKTKMSRKDPRKFKRQAGGALRKKDAK